MKKMINRETFRFLFKLIILFQLYSYQKFTTEAIQLSQTNENVSQFEKNDGNNLNDRMSQIEAKSQRQEKEIFLLKTTVGEDKRIIRQLRGRVSSLESLMLTSNSEIYEKLLLRPKRPYRLLPLHPASGEVRDKMEKEKAVADKRFYGPASNCNELGKLGYTLNGYYLVKGEDGSRSDSIEAVMCQFNLPNESKEGSNEERLGFVTIGKNLEKSPKTHSKENNIELVNSQLKTNKNELKEATEINSLGLISDIASTTAAKPFGLDITHGIPSPKRSNLINDLGKCLSADIDFYLYQSDCDPSNDMMLWSWNQEPLGSRDRHLCNGNDSCAASPGNTNDSIHLLLWYHLDEHGQRFLFSDSPSHPGFYEIKNDHGKCLSVNGKTSKTGAQIWVNDCNSSEAGQHWKWHVAYGSASPRRANLINSFGKCVKVDPKSHGGIGLQQSDCNSNDITMLWSWNEVSLGSRDRHICNGQGVCVATPFNSADNTIQVAYYHMDENGQRFNLNDSLSYPGFYIIKNDHGKCLSVNGNTNKTGAQIWTSDCNPFEAGQHWKWHN